jgi:hypothetical protein
LHIFENPVFTENRVTDLKRFEDYFLLGGKKNKKKGQKAVECSGDPSQNIQPSQFYIPEDKKT